MRCLPLIVCILVTGCTGLPDNITSVDGFDIQNYLGAWYEIARLDHSFEGRLSTESRKTKYN